MVGKKAFHEKKKTPHRDGAGFERDGGGGLTLTLIPNSPPPLGGNITVDLDLGFECNFLDNIPQSHKRKEIIE